MISKDSKTEYLTGTDIGKMKAEADENLEELLKKCIYEGVGVYIEDGIVKGMPRRFLDKLANDSSVYLQFLI